MKERARTGVWCASIEKMSAWCSENHFCFLNVTHDIREANIWNQIDLAKLWLYQLHYFDELNSETNQVKLIYLNQLIDRWIAENPIGIGNGWEPYPISLRIVNWVKWILNGHTLDEKQLTSLWIQADFLRQRLEYHLLGNHLFANLKALIFAGLFFAGRQAEVWYRLGIKLLRQEIKEQILNDGGHFERSPLYHSIILEDILDIINILRAYSKPIPNELKKIIPQMHYWLQAMCHVDGNLSFFNDTALKMAPSLDHLTRYLERLNLAFGCLNDDKLIKLEHSGYYRLQQSPVNVIIDAAPVGPDYIPGHAHADTLSFELSYGEQRIITNSGTSTYAISDLREQQRATRLHNTVEIDRQNSSDVWAAFRVARRARITKTEFQISDDKTLLCAQHDGYQFLPGKPLHERRFEMTTNKLMITDIITGNEKHDIASFFYFHPSVIIKVKQNHQFIIYNQNKLRIMKLCIKSNDVFACLADSFFYPEFGVAIPNKTLMIYAQAVLPQEIVVELTWK